ncbi:DUF29 family protein [Thiocapsa sp. UBA6158]|jgi:hypothetical protein|uniref:DUF29 family protein n=1 Tax=Thiocapsa sp. UBA6158 TaxID=1947692 RepID=UPI0025F31601|nr:DUF29 family protein [Thiocapsa sp. UBA6158]
MESTYDADFYAWANTQAALLRSGRIDQADIEHIAEETFPPACPFTIEQILNEDVPGDEPR